MSDFSGELEFSQAITKALQSRATSFSNASAPRCNCCLSTADHSETMVVLQREQTHAGGEATVNFSVEQSELDRLEMAMEDLVCAACGSADVEIIEPE